MFYSLWFLIPQLVSMSNRNFILDYPGATQQLVQRSQWHLVGFISAILLGVLVVRLLFDNSARTGGINLTFEKLRAADYQLLAIFYIFGVGATIYLGNQLMNSEGMRSELVKTPVGMLATILSFFGVFSMAVFIGHGLFERRYLMVFFAVVVLGGAIFFTGARGRLLWPLSLAVAYFLCRTNQMKIGHILALGMLGILVLLVFDPLLAALRSTRFSWQEVQDKVLISNLFMTKRNFDGFANFTVIVSQDSLAADPNILLRGGRSAFMNHYFPGFLEKGVGFGTTIPGMLWLAGNLKGLIGGAFVYGAILGLLSFWMRWLKTEPMFWSYMFAMTWIAACGGNFQESLDKMIAVVLPGFVWIAILPFRHLRQEGSVVGDKVSDSVSVDPG